jgi:hypothetical protein
MTAILFRHRRDSVRVSVVFLTGASVAATLVTTIA